MVRPHQHDKGRAADPKGPHSTLTRSRRRQRQALGVHQNAPGGKTEGIVLRGNRAEVTGPGVSRGVGGGAILYELQQTPGVPVTASHVEQGELKSESVWETFQQQEELGLGSVCKVCTSTVALQALPAA